LYEYVVRRIDKDGMKRLSLPSYRSDLGSGERNRRCAKNVRRLVFLSRRSDGGIVNW